MKVYTTDIMSAWMFYHVLQSNDIFLIEGQLVRQGGMSKGENRFQKYS